MLARLGIILGNSYVPPDLRAQYGCIPAPFLPFGAQPLYCAQITALKLLVTRIVLVLPSEFHLAPHDLRMLERLGCTCLTAPQSDDPAITLAAIRGALGTYETLTMLHGDAVPVGDDASSCDPVGGFDLTNTLAFRDEGCAPEFCVSEELEAMRRIDHKGYYSAKIRSVTKRFFNAITVEGDWVRKGAIDQRRIRFESNWFQQVPPQLQRYLPAFEATSDHQSYRTGLIRLPLLSELLVAGVSMTGWHGILESCAGFLNACHTATLPDNIDKRGLAALFHDKLVYQKSFERVEETCRQLAVPPDAIWMVNGKHFPSLIHTVEMLVDAVSPTSLSDLGFWHGDFHFGNIFFDAQRGGITVIDPRGSVDGNVTCVYGDIRYDMAKLSHSVIGLYDLIMTGHFQCKRDCATELRFAFDTSIVPDLKRLQSNLCDMTVAEHRFDDRDVRALTALMFLTMPPLHKDRPDRQWAMLANGFRLAENLLEVRNAKAIRRPKLEKVALTIDATVG